MADKNAQKLTTSELAGYDAATKEPEVVRPERPQLVKQQGETEEQPISQEIGNEPGELRDRASQEMGRIEGRREMGRVHEMPRRESPMPLFADSELASFREQWTKVQTGFVDEPRKTVEDADQLVASVMQRLAKGFADERAGLEKQWSQGENVSTEDLRVALQRYRSFFDRLLSL